MDQTVDNTEKSTVEGGADASHTETDTSAHETKAREMGWVPEDEFKGDKSRWIDAKKFIEHRPLVIELRETRKEIQEIKQAAAEWQKLNEAATERSVNEWKAKYAEAIQSKKDAVVQGDGEKFAEAEATQRELEASRPQPKKEPEKPKVHPDFPAWRAENEWFGVDKERTLQASLIGAHIAAQEGLEGRALFDAVNKKLAEFDEMTQGKARGGPQRGGRTATETKGIKSYENLKPEFRDKCDTQFKYFGSKGKPEDWRKTWTSKATDDMFRS